MIIPFKHFHYTLNIVDILAPGREFISAKCAQFTRMKLNERHFFFRTIVIYFLDKPYL